MSQAYERPKTPTRFQGVITTSSRPIETSPFKEGRPNNKYANPSMVSNDVFYEKHYDNPNKQMTPAPSPLGIGPNGYGKLNDYKDRYRHHSGQDGANSAKGSATPVTNKEQARSQLRDNYQNRSDRGDATPTRSNQGGLPVDYRAQGSRTPTRRNEPHQDLRIEDNQRRNNFRGDRTPSDQYRSNAALPRQPRGPVQTLCQIENSHQRGEERPVHPRQACRQDAAHAGQRRPRSAVHQVKALQHHNPHQRRARLRQLHQQAHDGRQESPPQAPERPR